MPPVLCARVCVRVSIRLIVKSGPLSVAFAFVLISKVFFAPWGCTYNVTHQIGGTAPCAVHHLGGTALHINSGKLELVLLLLRHSLRVISSSPLLFDVFVCARIHIITYSM